MRIEWAFSEADIEAVRTIVAEQKDNAFVRAREKRNLEPPGPIVDREAFWKELVACLLTSVQRSGPESPVTRFIRLSPFPLSLARCREQSDLVAYIQRAMRDHGGIRFTRRIPKSLELNIRYIHDDHWPELDQQLQGLRQVDSMESERAVCRDLIDKLHGVGPKQSRNLLQGLGQTKYEIPLDSRIGGWLRKQGFPIPLTSTALADEEYYEFALDGLQELCRLAGVFPCMFDAAVFSSFDGNAWNEENVVY